MLGNIPDIAKGFHKFLLDACDKYGKISIIHMGIEPWVIVNDVDQGT